MKLIAKIEFDEDLVMEYSAGPVLPIGRHHNIMKLYIDEDGQSGAINWEYEPWGDIDEDHDGDSVGIGLWFDDKNVTDYDGVFELPKQAIKLLNVNGYTTHDIEVD